MAPQAQALLYFHINPPVGPDGDSAAFEVWHADHLPRRIERPGFLTARRFHLAEGEGPRIMVNYDLADASALQSPDYLALRAEEAASAHDRDMLASAEIVTRRLYRCIDTDEPWSAAWTDHPPYVMSVALEPPPDLVDDFHSWYREEHSPMLMAAPGWRRIRRYEQVEGDGPRFMALHELESLDGFKSDEYTAAISTPWRIRVTTAVVKRERYIYKLAHGFARPG